MTQLQHGRDYNAGDPIVVKLRDDFVIKGIDLDHGAVEVVGVIREVRLTGGS